MVDRRRLRAYRVAIAAPACGAVVALVIAGAMQGLGWRTAGLVVGAATSLYVIVVGHAAARARLSNVEFWLVTSSLAALATGLVGFGVNQTQTMAVVSVLLVVAGFGCGAAIGLQRVLTAIERLAKEMLGE